jgi:hypothetical protein
MQSQPTQPEGLGHETLKRLTLLSYPASHVAICCNFLGILKEEFQNNNQSAAEVTAEFSAMYRCR